MVDLQLSSGEHTGVTVAQRQARIVARLCRFIEGREGVPTLEELAKQAGLSPSHTHRLFKAHTGLTPRAYAVGHRNEQMQLALQNSASVTEAIYAAGFSSSGRFYEASTAALGMTPSAYAQGGVNEEIAFAVGASSLGAVLVAATVKGVCCILLGDAPDALVEDLQRRFRRASLVGGDRNFEAIVAKVIGMIEDPGTGHELPLDLRGTVFQRRVWQALSQIPAGQTRTYGEIARMLGEPGAARAVAGACAANPLAVAVPCHRVVRSDGGLSGYRWGVERKRALLEREAGGRDGAE